MIDVETLINPIRILLLDSQAYGFGGPAHGSAGAPRSTFAFGLTPRARYQLPARGSGGSPRSQFLLGLTPTAPQAYGFGGPAHGSAGAPRSDIRIRSDPEGPLSASGPWQRGVSAKSILTRSDPDGPRRKLLNSPLSHLFNPAKSCLTQLSPTAFLTVLLEI